MKIIIGLLLVLIFPQYVWGEICLPDFLKQHSELYKSEYGYDDYLEEPDILSNRISQTFPVNSKTDTVYIKSYRSQGGGEGTSAWNSKQCISIYPHRVNIVVMPAVYKKSHGYSQLLSNWDIDVLKHLSKEYHATTETSETAQIYLTRIIVECGSIRIDTTTFLGFNSDKIKNLNQEQLDSLRETVYLIKNTKLIRTPYQLETPQDITEAYTQHSTHKETSLWQRIVDWFRRLWEAIFG